MASKLYPPYFTGSTNLYTCYKMHGRYYMRSKSSLTAERVKNDSCFTPTMVQARLMARASKLGAMAYKGIPLSCKAFPQYRMLTGKANLLLKQGLSEEQILATLINKYVHPIIQNAMGERHCIVKAKRVRTKRTPKPPFLRKYRRLRMVEWSVGNGEPSVYPAEALNSMLERLLESEGLWHKSEEGRLEMEDIRSIAT